MEVDDQAKECEILVGEDLIEECSGDCQKMQTKSWEPLTNDEINEVQKHLGMITRPTWH